MEHFHPIRVYYEDTDAGGIVYHSNYLKFCERGRTEFLRQLGVEQDIYLKQNIAFVVKAMDIDFKLAAKFNEELTVITRIQKIKKVSVEFLQNINNAQGQLVFSAQVKIGCVNTLEMKPSMIPAQITEVLESAYRD